MLQLTFAGVAVCRTPHAARRERDRRAIVPGMPDAISHTPAGRPRARALGIPFAGRPGPWNAITDVPGLQVGYATLVEGAGVRTGVTAIHPRGRADRGDPWVAG